MISKSNLVRDHGFESSFYNLFFIPFIIYSLFIDLKVHV